MRIQGRFQTGAYGGGVFDLSLKMSLVERQMYSGGGNDRCKGTDVVMVTDQYAQQPGMWRKVL